RGRGAAGRQVQRTAGGAERAGRGAGGGVLDQHRPVLRLLPGAQGLAARPDRGATAAVGRALLSEDRELAAEAVPAKPGASPPIEYPVAMNTKSQPRPVALVIHGGAGVIERDMLGAEDERAIHA